MTDDIYLNEADVKRAFDYFDRLFEKDPKRQWEFAQLLKEKSGWDYPKAHLIFVWWQRALNHCPFKRYDDVRLKYAVKHLRDTYGWNKKPKEGD